MILENKLSVSSRTSYYLMFAPALIMLLAVLYPFFQGVYTAFTNQNCGPQLCLSHRNRHQEQLR